MPRASPSRACSVFLPAPFARAQSVDNDSAHATEPGAVSCFDYYHFGSVQAKLTAPVAGTVSGTDIVFSGTLKNANPYPVVDGALYVKVFKSRGATNDGNGPDVVDQFFVKDGIAIPANGSVPISFSWRVPSYAQSGDYRLATFFTTSHKFNLLGLSFTDDVVGNTVPFTVVGEQEASVAFDKAGVSINGEPYHFAAFPPRVGAEPVTLTAVVRNTGATSQTATIAWKIYQWDAQQESNIVQHETQTVTIPAHASAPVSVTISDAKFPVYLAVGELSWKDTKFVIGVRFVRDGVDKLRLNFPGVMSFPLKAKQPDTLFSCLHNANDADVQDGRLELTLSDKNGRTIATHTYAGTVTSAMMGVASPFTPTKDYDYAVLNAKLYRGNALVDESSVTYDCNVIDPAQCVPKSAFADFLGNPFSGALFALGSILVLVGLIALLTRLKRASIPPAAPTV